MSNCTLGILLESSDRRVAITPSQAKKIADWGTTIHIQSGAGVESSFPDGDYENVATLTTRDAVLSSSDIIIGINCPSVDDLDKMKKGAYFVGMLEPFNTPEVIERFKSRGLHAFSMDMIPRSSIAQSMDILSSMASISGYKAVLTAAQHLPRYFPMMITAAGSVKPSTILVLGAGVAGLQAIATGRRLGAMVEAFDVRAAAKEEVLSLGAKFIEVEGAADDKDAGGYAVQQSEEYIKRQQAKVQEHASKADVVITTAQVRGRKAPVLVPASTVLKMKRGSVIVDLAASSGGNCELTTEGISKTENGVTIIGDSNLSQSMPQDASTLYGNNIINFLKLIIKEGHLTVESDNEIVTSCQITLDN